MFTEEQHNRGFIIREFQGFLFFFAMIFSSRFFKVILKPFLKPFLRAHKKTAHPFLGAGCSVPLFFQLW